MGLFSKAIDIYKSKKDPVGFARSKGVQVGENCKLESTHFGSEPYLISLGNHVEITSNVQFITHDGATWVFRNEDKYKDVIKYGKIVIKDNCFIGFGTIILPNVTIGPNAIVAAGSVVSKDVPPNSIVGGVPARVIGDVSEYAEKCLEQTPDYNAKAYKLNKKDEILRVLDV